MIQGWRLWWKINLGEGVEAVEDDEEGVGDTVQINQNMAASTDKSYEIFPQHIKKSV